MGGGQGGPPGPVVAQPGFHHDFGTVKGPLFHYGGPFHFKPPFTIGGKERTVPAAGGGSTASGHAVGGGAPVTAPLPQPTTSGGVIRVASASATRSNHPSPLWFLFPALLLALAAVAAVVFEPKPHRVENPKAGAGS